MKPGLPHYHTLKKIFEGIFWCGNMENPYFTELNKNLSLS